MKRNDDQGKEEALKRLEEEKKKAQIAADKALKE